MYLLHVFSFYNSSITFLTLSMILKICVIFVRKMCKKMKSLKKRNRNGFYPILVPSDFWNVSSDTCSSSFGQSAEIRATFFIKGKFLVNVTKSF